jgi:hypothetical protein
MAESSLSLGWPELKAAVGHFLGWGSSGWSSARETIIEGIVQTGYRRVLYPPAVAEGAAGYEWSFLRPSTTLSITSSAADYDLPDDYGNIVGKFHYAADVHLPSIPIIPVADLLDMRSASDRSGDPEFAAIRPKSSDGSTGQRSEVLFYPAPSTSRTLSYAYDAYQGALSDSAPYPLGGMHMSELYKESCLAVAESRNNDEIGLHNATFQSLLVDAIARDRKRGARTFGQMGQPEEEDMEVFRRGRSLYGGAYSITYKSQQI